MRQMKDEYAIVLDFLPTGRSEQRISSPVAQVLGEENFNLLEIVLREEATVAVEERLYIGAGTRDKVKSIKRKLQVADLTANANSELEDTVNKLVEKNEKRFVEFFNTSGSVTTRQHQLELLPGIGKKHMWQILEERKKKPFKSFDDIKKRVSLLPDPKKVIIKRIMEELEGTAKWYLFTSPPKDHEEF